MRQALAQASACLPAGDVPVGAVLVRDGEVLSVGRNRRVEEGSPLLHAELDAIERGARALGSWRLDACTLYVTLEPCVMCAGAVLQSRVGRVVYGADDAKAGAVRSLYQVLEDPRSPFSVKVSRGVLAEECAALLRSFFRERRGGK
ncbi:MAG: nucleoside deaminase [Deltaproteobacteria bacterium]|nr:MAG: nucleoside deaminase [Deltaproteobacteria bacterium]